MCVAASKNYSDFLLLVEIHALQLEQNKYVHALQLVQNMQRLVTKTNSCVASRTNIIIVYVKRCNYAKQLILTLVKPVYKYLKYCHYVFNDSLCK